MGWTIGRRLAGIGALSIMATVAVGVIGFTQTAASAEQSERALQVGHALATTSDAQHNASVILADASMLTAALSDARRAEVIEQMTEHADELREQLAILRAAKIDAEFAVLMKDFVPAVEGVLADAARLASLSGVLPAADFDGIRQRWDVLDDRSDAAKTFLAERSAREVAATGSSAERTRLILLLVTLASAAVVGSITWLLARVIATPIRATKAVLQQIAAGDFTGRVAVRGRDDLGQMAAALNGTVTRVGDAIRRIAQEARTLSDSAHELTAVSQRLAAGADQVATEADAASGSAKHANDDVQAIAAGAEQMHSSISQIARNALATNDVVAAAVTAAEGATRTIGKLTNSSDQIGQVAKIIASIAEQTNLLALNATIEAARAGETGKGFAVVAGEVKDLARETAKATEDIAHQIAALQADSAEAAEVIAGIATRVNEIAESQHVIAAAVEEQSVSTKEINNRVTGAAANTADIAGRIATLTSTSTQATAAAGHTQRAAEALAATAARLQTVVTEFRLAG